MIEYDSRGNPYVMANSWLRVTLTEDDEIRINVINEAGRVYRGPQFPAEDAGLLVAALTALETVRGGCRVKQPWVLYGSR